MTRVLAGRRPVLEGMRGKASVRQIYTEPRRGFPDVLEAAEARSIPIATRDRAELDRLSDGVRHQGVVALADDYQFSELDEILAHAEGVPVLVALDQITDPQNLGAIIRTAVTLGLDGVIFPKHRAAGITSAVVRASAGATEHASIARVTNLQRTLLALSESGMEIVGLDARADLEIHELTPSSAGRILVIGSEGKGLRRMVRQRCDIVVQIPQKGPMDSLNASVAAAIAMYEISRKRVANDR
ncbi:MAG: 23S rRNA (guanosine(2251)-2'-O)-methyltransferase RlmB [Deltaproteobacteria bacterium]|nr:23S rRNA (guanosine(2251)-2'-O)-methyltransferase RlmB [Deltaproteobacteria bacterium]